MWIKPLVKRGKSGSQAVNVLWRHSQRPLYLTDNHLAALWCWRRELPDRTAPYTLVHVDTHWDARAMYPDDMALLESEWNALDDFEDFIALRSTYDKMAQAPSPLVRWDNYVDAFLKLYPNLRDACASAYQLDSSLRGCERDGSCAARVFGEHACPPSEFLERVDTVLSTACAPVILNTDVDYFFADRGGRKVRTSEFPIIRDFFACLDQHREKIGVMTVALSPECCGGWAPAEEACRAAFAGLRTRFPLARPRAKSAGRRTRGSA